MFPYLLPSLSAPGHVTHWSLPIQSSNRRLAYSYPQGPFHPCSRGLLKHCWTRYFFHAFLILFLAWYNSWYGALVSEKLIILGIFYVPCLKEFITMYEVRQSNIRQDRIKRKNAIKCCNVRLDLSHSSYRCFFKV